MRKPITLIAGRHRSRHFGTKPYLAEALPLTGQDEPLVLYIGAASGDDRGFGSALTKVLEAAGAHEVLWPKLAGKKNETGSTRRSPWRTCRSTCAR